MAMINLLNFYWERHEVNVNWQMCQSILEIMRVFWGYENDIYKTLFGILLSLFVVVSLLYSFGQAIVDKFTKLSKIGLPMHCLTVYFFEIFWHKC